MSILLFHNSLELLDGRSAYFVLRRVSLALDDHQAVRMDGKAIDTKVVRFSSSPSVKASPMKEAHAVLLKIKGVHAKQVLSERHLLHRHGETGGAIGCSFIAAFICALV